MAKLDLTPEEFGDYISALMLDKMINMDDVMSNNEEFTELMQDFKGMGGKSKLTKMYLDMPSEMRMKYKWTRKTLTGESNSIHTIRIIPEEKKVKDPEKEGLLRKAIRKIKKVMMGDAVKFTAEDTRILNEMFDYEEGE